MPEGPRSVKYYAGSIAVAGTNVTLATIPSDTTGRVANIHQHNRHSASVNPIWQIRPASGSIYRIWSAGIPATGYVSVGLDLVLTPGDQIVVQVDVANVLAVHVSGYVYAGVTLLVTTLPVDLDEILS